MAEITTKEEFRDRMSTLYRRINEEQTKIKESPGLSAESTAALKVRSELIYDFVKTQIEGQKKFGSYGVDKKGNPTVVYTVPKTMTDLLARFENQKTRMTAAELVAPLVSNINLGALGQIDNPAFYELKVTPAQLKQVDKIGAGGPIGPVASGTTVAATGPTAPTGATGPVVSSSGGGTKVGSTKIIGGVSNTWDGKKWVPEKKKVKVDWERKFREMFPDKIWMLDIDRTKYADVFKLFQKSIDGEVYKTAEGLARFKAQLEGTSFVKELATTDKVRQVKAVVGDLGFDSMPLNNFLTKAMNMGWEGTTLKQEVYKEAFRKDDAGAFVNPTAITRAKASNDYLTVAKIGKSYFSTVADDTIQGVLTGGVMQQDVERQQRELAKQKYGHLSNLIEQGFTMEQLSSSFKEQTARILEKDPAAIDMSQADYEQAFNFGEEGKKRMMSSGEWEIKLRSDPRYNWGSTQNAKDEARRLSASISQAFGRVI